MDRQQHYPHLDAILTGTIKPHLIRQTWDETVRVIASMEERIVSPSLVLHRLGSYARKCQDWRHTITSPKQIRIGLGSNQSAGEETRLESLHPKHKQLPLTSEGNKLLASATRTQILSDFVKSGTETLRGGESTKT